MILVKSAKWSVVVAVVAAGIGAISAVGGQAAPSPYASMFALVPSLSTGRCTGILFAPDVLTTAVHCLSDFTLTFSSLPPPSKDGGPAVP